MTQFNPSSFTHHVIHYASTDFTVCCSKIHAVPVPAISRYRSPSRIGSGQRSGAAVELFVSRIHGNDPGQSSSATIRPRIASIHAHLRVLTPLWFLCRSLSRGSLPFANSVADPTHLRTPMSPSISHGRSILSRDSTLARNISSACLAVSVECDQSLSGPDVDCGDVPQVTPSATKLQVLPSTRYPSRSQ